MGVGIQVLWVSGSCAWSLRCRSGAGLKERCSRPMTVARQIKCLGFRSTQGLQCSCVSGLLWIVGTGLSYATQKGITKESLDGL